jgi:hypothetical protein
MVRDKEHLRVQLNLLSNEDIIPFVTQVDLYANLTEKAHPSALHKSQRKLNYL